MATSQLHASDSSLRLKDAAGGSVLDQLHAEQKSTIEALTYQIEFYRQREERAKHEIDTLRQCVGREQGESGVARLAAETRALGDEVDALRAQQSAWQDEKRRLQRRQLELEQQLQDAKLSLSTFTQAVEQLELKIQRRDAEEQTRALQMEQDLRAKSHECAQWKRESDALKMQVENMQTARDENERLRREVQTLTQQSSAQRLDAEACSLQIKNELRVLQQRLDDAELLGRQQEKDVNATQAKLAHSTNEASTLRVDVEKKAAEIRELNQQLQRSAELLELREKLLTSDASSRQERESQRHELAQQISKLEQEKATLHSDLVTRERQLEATKKEMETMKTRLMTKDHGVLVATLRSEMAGVKERLRAEFKHEKDALVAEKASLSKEITLLSTRLAEKERFIHRLQDEMLGKESSEQHSAREISTLKSTVRQLEAEVSRSQSKYQQLLDTRSSLAEQLDYGFKELLEDENTASSLICQVGQLQQDLTEARQLLAVSEARRNAAADELQGAQAQHEKITSALRKKIDDLYEELRRREDDAHAAKQLEMKVYLLDQEKNNHDTEISALRTQLEKRITTEQLAVEKLRETIASLKTEKSQQHAQLIGMRDEISVHESTIDNVKKMATSKDLEIEASAREMIKLQERIQHLERKLDEARATISSNQDEKGKRERKLFRERRTLEEQVAKLVSRIESVSNRNKEMGDKIVALMKQLKGYEAEIVGVETLLNAEKTKRNELSRALSRVQRTAGEDANSTDSLKRRLHEVTSLKESYQGEVHQLKRSVERAQNEKDILHRQRDEAITRVSMLVKCQEEMKSTIEAHTAELIEEIEAIQGQLDDERKRTTVFLANEKTLLRDITEKNSTIERLQQAVASFHQQQQRGQSMDPHSDLRKLSPRDGRYSSFPPTTSPTARGAPPTPKTSNSSAVSSSAQELDRLLGNLERISEFSSARSPSASFSR